MSKFGKDLIESLTEAVARARGKPGAGLRVTTAEALGATSIRRNTSSIFLDRRDFQS